MSFEFDGSDFLELLEQCEREIAKATVESMHDAVDDLARISSNIAPIKISTLRKAVKKTVTPFGSMGATGEVAFSAVENSKNYGRFNYALWTHEYEYNLGDLSKASPGTDGYNVGNKYLERPLKGEEAKYIRWWQENIAKALE
ncbi:MAG: hypothetical protein ACQET8_22680 [Bacillota bacterium]